VSVPHDGKSGATSVPNGDELGRVSFRREIRLWECAVRVGSHGPHTWPHDALQPFGAHWKLQVVTIRVFPEYNRSPSAVTDEKLSPSIGFPEQTDESGDLAMRLEFLELTADDATRLRSFQPVFDRHAVEYLDAFYRHLAMFEETSRFLEDPVLVERLKLAQREFFDAMLQARWDEEFLCQRRRAGEAHAEKGIEPKDFLGSYNQFVQFCLANSSKDISPDTLLVISTLMKAVFLDVGLTLDAYFEQLTRDLRQALELYWAANNELKQFAHFTSHDLKTPLGTVANYCDEVLDEFEDQLPKDARQLIEAARATVFRMSGTIDELLSTALATETADPDDEIAVGKVIDQAIERVQPLLEREQIDVIVNEPLPTVLANHVQLREVFYNLLANAAKFIDKSPGRIVIEAELSPASCIVSVVDNGPGISREDQSKIFAPFRRLSRNRDDSGSGLGLYFSRNLVEQQGGQLWVESEPGRGSRFRVQLKRPAGNVESAG